MDIKIENGVLFIKRGQEFIKQLCPFSAFPDVVCGEWCAMFGEITEGALSKEFYLELCHGKVIELKDFAIVSHIAEKK